MSSKPTILNRLPPNTRAQYATVTVYDVVCEVVYFTRGAYLEATETDPAERPSVYVVSVEAGDVTPWIADGCVPSESTIAEAVEQQLDGSVAELPPFEGTRAALAAVKVRS